MTILTLSLLEVPGDNSMPVKPSQVQSPILPMENVSPQVHSQDVADEGMSITPDIPVSTQFTPRSVTRLKGIHAVPCSHWITS